MEDDRDLLDDDRDLLEDEKDLLDEGRDPLDEGRDLLDDDRDLLGGRQGRVGHSVLFRSVRYVLLSSKKRTLHSFPFFSVLFSSFWRLMEPKRTLRSFLFFSKERKRTEKRNVLLQRTEKNGKNAPFFCKERKRTERTLRSFAKNVTFSHSFAKRTGERYVLFLRYI